MTITVNPSSAATLRVRPEDITCLVVPILMSSSEAATSGTFYDAIILTNPDASAWNVYDITAPLGDSITLENQSPGVLSISGSRVSKAESGIGFVNVRRGTTAKSVECDVRVTGGWSYSVFDGYTPGTVSAALFDAIAALLDTEKQTAYFTTQNHASGTYTRNANCWLAGVDLECVAVASKAPGGEWTRQGAPILIAPQVVAMCNHFSRSAGTQVRFADAFGNIFESTIAGLATTHPATGDMQIGVLASPVTGVNPCAVVGDWIEQDPAVVNSAGVRSSYVGGAGFWIDQQGNVYATMFGTSSLSYGYGVSGAYRGETFTNVATEFPVNHNIDPLGGEFSAFGKTPVQFDSGSFCGVILDGSAALLLTWHYPSSGTPFFDGRLELMIESAKENAGIVGSITLPVVAPDPTL